jgi:hypothetical protein
MAQEPSTGETGRILKFTPRHRAGMGTDVPDLTVLAPEDRHGAEADDYSHRMKTNIAALAVVLLLIACGLWLADGMAEFRAAQECLTMGARGTCAAIRVPERQP